MSTQQELIKQFKTARQGDIFNIIFNMTPETAVSLLSMTTKNVTTKLYSFMPHRELEKRYSGMPALNAIINNIASGTNVVEFKTLINFLKEKNLLSNATWDLFINHAGYFDIEDFITFAKNSNNRYIPFKRLDESFFDSVLSNISPDRRYTVHSSITDAFLYYKADELEKIIFLQDYKDYYRVNYSISYDCFKNLPYEYIKKYLIVNEKNGSVLGSCVHYLDDIIQNKDIESSKAILLSALTDNNHEYPYQLYKFFDFNKKIEILENCYKHYIKFDIKEIFSEGELPDFQRIALTKKSLSKYISDTPLSTLSENIKIAHVTSRILDTNLYIPLSEELIESLDKDSISRIISSVDNSQTDISVTTFLYNKLSREELINLLGDLTTHGESISLADRMTQDEIDHCSSKDKAFFRMHIDKCSKAYLDIFKDKKLFKEAVGDRRNGRNNSFGSLLEARLAS